jgi:ubiquinol-cytochrome c reductase iron-sulfur subunit
MPASADKTRVTAVATSNAQPPVIDPVEDPERRDFLAVAAVSAGAIGVCTLAVPFVGQLGPDSQTIAAGAPVELDLSTIAEGQGTKLFWRGKLIFVRHRTKEEIEAARKVDVSTLRDPQSDQDRVKAGKDQWLIVYGNCTHLGCVPIGNSGDYNGWFCPCHGSVFDTSGRIRQGPAPTNLAVPPYAFLSDTKIQIG